MRHQSVARTNGIWKDILQNLRGRMTKGTFDSVFAGSQGELVGEDQLIVYAPGQAAFEWMSNRWAGLIQEVAQSVLGREIAVAFQLPKEPEVLDAPVEPLRIEGDYYQEYNRIVQPDRVFVGTQYFRQKWGPLLGPTLFALILDMRQRCYYGRGENHHQRNTFTATYKDLAKTIGVSEKTIKRLFAKDQEGNFTAKYIGYFVEDVTLLKAYADGKIRSVGSKFTIYLDDPLTPEDERNLADS